MEKATQGDRDIESRRSDGRAAEESCPDSLASKTIGILNKQPNVLIIVTDDQRQGLSVMPRTRRLFRKEGRVLPHFFATSPLCCPSRASIFTGRYPHNHGVHNNSLAKKLDQRFTIQAYLQEAGYRTGYFGKYFNGWPVDEGPPSFDEWASFTSNEDRDYYRGGVWNVNGELQQINQYATKFVGDQSVSFLEESELTGDDQPWLMYVAPTAPHHPFTAAPRFKDAPIAHWPGNPALNERDLSDKPEFVRDNRNGSPRKARRIRRTQFRTLKSVDLQLGRIFDTLNRLDEDRETFAIFVSDNGYLWGEHQLLGKRSSYLQTVSVPMLMRWPGQIPPGSQDKRFTANVDIAPTILDAAGLSPPSDPPMDGRSLLDESWSRSELLFEFGPDKSRGHPTWAALLTKRFHYTEYYWDDDGSLREREFYDLEQDPWELNNAFGDDDPNNDPLRPHRLHQRLKTARACSGDQCP